MCRLDREGERTDGRPGHAAHLEREADEQELKAAGGREGLQVEVLDDVDAGFDDQNGVAGQRAEFRVDAVGVVEGDVVSPTQERLPGREPACAFGADARRGEISLGVREDAVPARPDEDAVTGTDLGALANRGLLEVVAGDQIAAREALPTALRGHVQEDAPTQDRWNALDPELGEPPGRLDAGVHTDAAVHLHVPRLVAQGVDVRAGVLGHGDQPRSARPCLALHDLVPTVQRVNEARPVAGVDRRAYVAVLLQVEHSQLGHQGGEVIDCRRQPLLLRAHSVPPAPGRRDTPPRAQLPSGNSEIKTWTRSASTASVRTSTVVTSSTRICFCVGDPTFEQLNVNVGHG